MFFDTFKIFHITPWLVRLWFWECFTFWDFEGSFFTSKLGSFKIKNLEIDQKILSLKKQICKIFTKSPIFEKRKKDALNLKANPREHIFKHSAKKWLSIHWSGILIFFEISHMTHWLVARWFWLFLTFLRLLRTCFGIKILDIGYWN